MTRDELEQSFEPGELRDLEDGIRFQAEHDADLLADALGRTSPSTPSTLKTTKPMTGRMLSLALLTAAALRLQRWYDEGHDRYFTASLPDRAIVREIMERLSSGTFDDAAAARARKFATDILVFWVAQFSWSARRHLGADVVIGGADAITDDNLRQVADFLWGNRRSELTPKGDTDGYTETQ